MAISPMLSCVMFHWLRRSEIPAPRQSSSRVPMKGLQIATGDDPLQLQSALDHKERRYALFLNDARDVLQGAHTLMELLA